MAAFLTVWILINCETHSLPPKELNKENKRTKEKAICIVDKNMLLLNSRLSSGDLKSNTVSIVFLVKFKMKQI